VGGVIYLWKYFDEGYNFALDLTSIKDLQKKLWVFKVAGDLILGILRLLTWSPKKNDIWV
jgi:hypothetical protein